LSLRNNGFQVLPSSSLAASSGGPSAQLLSDAADRLISGKLAPGQLEQLRQLLGPNETREIALLPVVDARVDKTVEIASESVVSQLGSFVSEKPSFRNAKRSFAQVGRTSPMWAKPW
jgi:hypothetical protein